MIKEKNEKRERGEKEDRYYFYLLVFGSGLREAVRERVEMYMSFGSGRI